MHAWIVAPSFPLARQSWRELIHFVPKELITKRPNESTKSVELVNGILIEVKSADDPQGLVSVGLDYVLITEAGKMKKDAWEESLRPCLASPGRAGLAVINGTPKGKNWFYDLYCRGLDPEYSDYESFHHSSLNNPYFDPKEWDEAKQTLSELIFRQEFMAEFLEDSSSVFRNIKGCIHGELEEPNLTKRYYAGIDLAKMQDFTVICIIDQQGHVCFFDRFNEINWPLQKQRIISVCKKYNAQVFLDSTGIGDPIFDDLMMSGLKVQGYKFTNESKANLIHSLSLSLELQKVTYPKIDVLINELSQYEYEILQTGRFRFNAPEGKHDDCVIGLALANWCLLNRIPEITNFKIQTFGQYQTRI